MALAMSMEPVSLKTSPSLKPLSVLMVVLLSLQFLLGVAAALDTAFPSPSDLGVRWGIAWGSVFSLAHIICGSLLVLMGVLTFVHVWRSGSARWKKNHVIGLFSMVVAAGGGVLLVSTGVGAFAMLMAAGFLVAMVIYAQFMGEMLVT